ncbi:unnamed protein product, partial [Didymodactylos carnosus]
MLANKRHVCLPRQQLLIPQQQLLIPQQQLLILQLQLLIPRQQLLILQLQLLIPRQQLLIPRQQLPKPQQQLLILQLQLLIPRQQLLIPQQQLPKPQQQLLILQQQLLIPQQQLLIPQLQLLIPQQQLPKLQQQLLMPQPQLLVPQLQRAIQPAASKLNNLPLILGLSALCLLAMIALCCCCYHLFWGAAARKRCRNHKEKTEKYSYKTIFESNSLPPDSKKMKKVSKPHKNFTGYDVFDGVKSTNTGRSSLFAHSSSRPASIMSSCTESNSNLNKLTKTGCKSSGSVSVVNVKRLQHSVANECITAPIMAMEDVPEIKLSTEKVRLTRLKPCETPGTVSKTPSESKQLRTRGNNSVSVIKIPRTETASGAHSLPSAFKPTENDSSRPVSEPLAFSHVIITRLNSSETPGTVSKTPSEPKQLHTRGNNSVSVIKIPRTETASGAHSLPSAFKPTENDSSRPVSEPLAFSHDGITQVHK